MQDAGWREGSRKNTSRKDEDEYGMGFRNKSNILLNEETTSCQTVKKSCREQCETLCINIATHTQTEINTQGSI